MFFYDSNWVYLTTTAILSHKRKIVRFWIGSRKMALSKAIWYRNSARKVEHLLTLSFG
jgi:hypothetical protein